MRKGEGRVGRGVAGDCRGELLCRAGGKGEGEMKKMGLMWMSSRSPEKLR